MKKAIPFILAFGLSLFYISASAQSASHAHAATFTLYDGAKNTAFRDQGWFSSIPNGAVQTVSSGSTTLNTTSSNSLQAGYGKTPTPISLDRAKGYTLGFTVQLLSESHSSPNRAGFSLIALGGDLRGIELGFWKNDTSTPQRIWAQNDGATKPPRFTRAEGTSFNPATSLVRYDLAISGDRYALFANRNFKTPILSGNLRNYSPEGFPYNTPNFVFLGDNTTSAQASVRITQVDLTAGVIATTALKSAKSAQSTAAPEPATLLGSGLAVGLVGLLKRKRRL